MPLTGDMPGIGSFINTWGLSTDLLVFHHLPEHSPLADIIGPLSQPPAQTDLPTPAQATMKNEVTGAVVDCCNNMFEKT